MVWDWEDVKLIIIDIVFIIYIYLSCYKIYLNYYLFIVYVWVLGS